MASKDVITFDLSGFCEHFDSDQEFVETIELPKEVLEAIDQNIESTIPEKASEEDDESASLPKKAHFADLQDEDLDEIAHKTNAQQTHAQTRWAVEMREPTEINKKK